MNLYILDRYSNTYLFFQAPWTAALMIKDNITGNYDHHCGGSIIGEKHILTAAHCLDHRINPQISNAESVKSIIKVVVGMENPGLNCSRKEDVEYQIKDYFLHPEFNFPYFDAAILELETKLTFTRGISKICLSRASTDDLTGHAVSLSGWGAKEQGGLPQKSLRGTRQLAVTSVQNCKNKTSFFTYDTYKYVTVFERLKWFKTEPPNTEPPNGEIIMESLICIEDLEPNGLLGSCGGDSGSPVVQRAFDGSTRYYQVGIVSGGRCSDKDTPSILTHIGHKRVYEFISKTSKCIT